jgi:sensor histidine kinase YesM
VAIFGLTRWRITKREAKKREQIELSNKVTYLKQQALSALINPHFIFNCMNSIQMYLYNNDNFNANIYLADFASLIRSTMENAQEAFIDLEKEIARITIYLKLEQFRFGQGLQYTISLDSMLAGRTVRIPNMIIQPYVENAIWHGIIPNNGIGKIGIDISLQPDNLIRITISDDGVGLGKARVLNSSKSEKRSYGMSLTKERLDLLRQLTGQFYHVKASEIISDEGKVAGTVIEIFLPLDPNEVANV